MKINIDESLIEKIDQCIIHYKDDILKDLETLVKIPSVREAPQEGMPYGKACYDILDASLKMMEREGFAGRFAHGNEYVVATKGEGKKTIGIFAHGDVVSAEGAWLFGKPFELTPKDGFLIGRGCDCLKVLIRLIIKSS